MQVTQGQDELSHELSTVFANTVEEPSQSDLEDELSGILEDTFPPVPQTFSLENSDLDLEKELDDILKEDSSQDISGLSDLMNGIIFIM